MEGATSGQGCLCVERRRPGRVAVRIFSEEVARGRLFRVEFVVKVFEWEVAQIADDDDPRVGPFGTDRIIRDFNM
jgi:hypothetical protein